MPKIISNPIEIELELRAETPKAWVKAVLNNFDQFLLDHAACEKKASSMAMTLIARYPDKPELIKAMADLAVEELVHFREVIAIIQNRKLTLVADEKDLYVRKLREQIARGRNQYLLDQLLVAAVVEARGHERFTLIADHLSTGELKKFYSAIAQSEARHYQLFLQLALCYFNQNIVDEQLQRWLEIEAEVVIGLPIRSALH